jgi:hypothetical protein
MRKTTIAQSVFYILFLFLVFISFAPVHADNHYATLVKSSREDCTLYALLVGDQEWIEGYSGPYLLQGNGTAEIGSPPVTEQKKLLNLGVFLMLGAFNTKNPDFKRPNNRFKALINGKTTACRGPLRVNCEILQADADDKTNSVNLLIDVITKLDEMNPLKDKNSTWATEEMVMAAVSSLSRAEKDKYGKFHESMKACHIRSLNLKSQSPRKSRGKSSTVIRER